MPAPLRIVHTLAAAETEASGPSYTVPRLCGALACLGHTVELITLGEESRQTIAPGFTHARLPADAVPVGTLAKLGRSRAMAHALVECAADVFHTHGLWMMPNVYPATAARRSGKPFLLAPRGMLGRDALKFSAGVKRVFWTLWQQRAAAAVSCFHATAESEFEDIRAFGLKQPVAVIPNGIDLPELDGATGAHDAGDEPPFVLSLGRVHPKKGLDRLIAAFALQAARHPLWRLRIVGPDEGGHASELRRQIAAAGLDGRVSIEPPVFGAEKFALMRRARVFALSTLHENFGMTVAESLAVETPVISTRGAPWAGLGDHRCGWWVDHGPEAMAAALGEAMALPENEQRAMGARGRDWMRRDFAWDGIAVKTAAVYRWLRQEGERPSWVLT